MPAETDACSEEVAMALYFLRSFRQLWLIGIECRERVGEQILLRQNEQEIVLFKYIHLCDIRRFKNSDRFRGSIFCLTIGDIDTSIRTIDKLATTI